MKHVIFGLAGILVLAKSAAANDTMAELRTGGLEYVISSHITMAEEELFLSMDEVRVDYVFRNESDKDVTSIIAFPMPDIAGSPDSNVAIPDFEADNFLGFTVTQDGQSIQPQLQQRASALSVDFTEELKRRNIPLLPYSDKAVEALKGLPPEILKEWETKGLIFADEFDAGQGWQTIYRPIWTMHSTYWWKTTFPAKKDVRVSHRYKPSIGGTVAISFLSNGKPSEGFNEYKTRYCMDDSFVKTAAKLEKAANSGGAIYTEAWLSYVLKTGANWSGNIGKFKLTIDKGKPDNYISLCADGIKKTGPTTFVMEKTDFWPQKDLDLLFLVANPPMPQ
ncbi:DUF4424 domain-containing protein [Rhizobium helianthi]|uniref:DUF4424 domain-containing protein n=1 Tax=Rhizobium helianthi TaxID=1132695 RepID=A0ABW4M5B4_9HYPH